MGAHTGLAHKGPAHKGKWGAYRLMGAHKGPAHKGLAHKGQGIPQGPRGAELPFSKHIFLLAPGVAISALRMKSMTSLCFCMKML